MPAEPNSNSTAHAEQTLQDLVYAVSHDLGASVRAIKGFSELLTRRYADSLDDDGRNFLRLMGKGAADLQGQLDGLLAYSRVTTRGKPLIPTSLTEVWQSVFDRSSEKRRLAAVTVESTELPVVRGDSQQLAQLFFELLDNAIKFRRDEPLKIQITAHQNPTRPLPASGSTLRYCQVEFRDNGRGIAQQHLNRVFQIFQRCCADVPGVGAGLAIAQRIVDRHGGEIWAESELEVGSLFAVTLPLAD